MNSHSDQQLLREYTERGSEPAFSEIVRRNLDWVYSAALRLVRDTHMAEDVSQVVFLALAQNARRLSERAVLAGWLHRTTHNLSSNAIRSDVRRRAREQEAAGMNDLFVNEPDPNAFWESIAPHLDAALTELSDPDRDVVLMRYFQRKSAQEMSQTLGISSEAAQKRVNRAVERLREFFAKRGIAVGANGLIVLMTANAVQAAPSGSAALIAAAVLSKTPFHTLTAITTAHIAMTTLQKVLITAAALAAVGIVIQQAQEASHLRQKVEALELRQTPAVDLKPAEPAARTAAITPVNPVTPRSRPPVAIAAAPPPTPTNRSAAVPFPSTEVFALLTNKVPKLTLEQVKPYLDAHERNAASLLAAFRTTTDPTLLAEALQKFPDDPQVAFEAAINRDATPDEKRQYLDALKQAAPDNSLADYLSGLAHLKAGETAEGLQDFSAAAGKPQFQDYSQSRIQTDEEAYLAAGYPPGEAKLLANAFLATPQLIDVKQVGQSLVSLAADYQQSGDQSSHATALQMAADLGRRFDDPSSGATLLNQLVGIAVERAALNAMDPTSVYGTSGQTVQQRIDQLAQQKEAIHVLTAQADPLWKTLSDQDWLAYHAQLATSGEETALRWLVSNYGQR